MNRRQFLKATTAGLVLAGMNHHVHAQAKPLRVGLIGSGWYGKCDIFRLIQLIPEQPLEVVSICDPDKKMLDDACKQVADRQNNGRTPRGFNDFRDLLKDKDLDIVHVGSPDHWHALQGIAAMEAGADLYLQKPISVDVLEGKALLDCARKNNRVVQIGLQRRSTPHLVDAIEKVIKPGLLGTIGHVDICCYYHMRANGNPPVHNVPDYFDYEMWTGPAPLRPFDAPMNNQGGLPHKRWWRTFMEYGNGIVGDMCVHMLDTVRWMLNLPWPSRISSQGGIFVQKEGKSNISDTQNAVFEFDKPRLNVSWVHRAWGNAPSPDWPWAALIHGDKGTLKVSTQKYEFIPQGKKQATIAKEAVYEYDKYEIDKTEAELERHVASAIRAYWRDMLKARADRGKTRPVADIEEGHITTASCILANNSMALGGRTLVWDAAKHECVNDPEANKLLKRAYRGEWKHPAA